MGMVLNTNIGAIQAQRAITEAREEMESAMERLSTGKRINSAADDAAGLAMVERMNSQIRGLTMATKNANDGIALLRTVENALVEVSGMLQRMRELAVQSANATNSATERAFADNELNSLQLEISRVSANTRYNGTQVLNGTFSAKALQVGTMSGEEINFTIDSVESSLLGAYVMTGDNSAGAYAPADATTAGYTSTTNNTDDVDDFTIVGNGKTRAIDIAANDSAKAVARKVNSVAGATNVFAQARTYLHLASSTSTSANYQLRINGTSTASFAISSTDVSDAVSKINAIFATTGVMATATTENKILLSDADGDDIIVRNASAGTNLTVRAVKSDGVTEAGTLRTLSASGAEVAKVDVADVYAAYLKWANSGSPSAAGSLQTTFNGNTVTLVLATSADAGSTSTSATLGQDITAANFAARFALAYNAHSGSSSSSAAAGTSDGATTGGKVITFTQTNTGSFNNLNGLTVGIDTDTTDGTSYSSATKADNTTSVVETSHSELVTGAATSSSSDTTKVVGTLRMTSSNGFTVTQTNGGTDDTWFADGTSTAALESIGMVDISTQIGASYSIATIDGALETVSGMRGSLGTLNNRLDYSVSNLMKVTEYTIGARSRIEDADFAAETSRLAKAQVLQQAGASMLSQANASTELVLQVLRG
jgi:flagellin